MYCFESFLRKHVLHKEIGWREIGEYFTRYQLVKTPWFNVYLHQLDAPNWHPECHDHPWGFVAILLKNGYLERSGGKDVRRWPGAVLFRPATFVHNVITPYGTSWSLIFTTRKSRDWGFLPCARWIHRPTLSYQDYRELYEKH
jgi:hypothetical protein